MFTLHCPVAKWEQDEHLMDKSVLIKKQKNFRFIPNVKDTDHTHLSWSLNSLFEQPSLFFWAIFSLLHFVSY